VLEPQPLVEYLCVWLQDTAAAAAVDGDCPNFKTTERHSMEIEELKEEVFAQHLNTKFYVPLEDRRVELELVKILGDKNSLDKIEGVNRFALYFLGPGDFCLPQSIYPMEHDSLGTLEIFIVPVGIQNNRYQYEAIFSHMEKPEGK
jgi:hypothetical protein